MECGSTNLMGSTKWAYHKEWTFAIDYIYLKSYFEYKNLLKIVDYCNSSPNIRIHAFRKYFSFIWGCISPISILNYNYIAVTTMLINQNYLDCS